MNIVGNMSDHEGGGVFSLSFFFTILFTLFIGFLIVGEVRETMGVYTVGPGVRLIVAIASMVAILIIISLVTFSGIRAVWGDLNERQY